MSFPFYFPVVGFRVPAHLVFETLAYSIGFAIFRRLQREGDPVPKDIRWTIIAAAALGAAVGSKVFYWFEDPSRILHHWNDLRILLGGKTIVGGLIGGLFAVEYAKRKIGFTGRTGDLFAVPLCAGIAVGRIGCFLSGLADDTYGSPTTLPWGIDFGDGIKRHPAQLYELLFLAALGAFLLRAMRKPHRQGDIFKFFMVAYFGWRVIIDFLKPDPRFLVFNTLQWACCAMLIYYYPDIRRWLMEKSPVAIVSPANDSRS